MWSCLHKSALVFCMVYKRYSNSCSVGTGTMTTQDLINELNYLILQLKFINQKINTTSFFEESSTQKSQARFSTAQSIDFLTRNLCLTPQSELDESLNHFYRQRLPDCTEFIKEMNSNLQTTFPSDVQKKGIKKIVDYLTHNRIRTGMMLAHGMGLGKTLSTLAALYVFCKMMNESSNSVQLPALVHVLIVAPNPLHAAWKDNCRKLSELVEKNMSFKRFVCVSVSSYEKAYDNMQDHIKKHTHDLKYFSNNASLVVVVDEAHGISNDTARSHKIHSIVDEYGKLYRTSRLILLSGTPVTRNLDQYSNLLQLIDPYVYKDQRGFQDILKTMKQCFEIKAKLDTARGAILDETVSTSFKTEYQNLGDLFLLLTSSHVDRAGQDEADTLIKNQAETTIDKFEYEIYCKLSKDAQEILNKTWGNMENKKVERSQFYGKMEIISNGAKNFDFSEADNYVNIADNGCREYKSIFAENIARMIAHKNKNNPHPPKMPFKAIFFTGNVAVIRKLQHLMWLLDWESLSDDCRWHKVDVDVAKKCSWRKIVEMDNRDNENEYQLKRHEMTPNMIVKTKREYFMPDGFGYYEISKSTEQTNAKTKIKQLVVCADVMNAIKSGHCTRLYRYDLHTECPEAYQDGIASATYVVKLKKSEIDQNDQQENSPQFTAVWHNARCADSPKRQSLYSYSTSCPSLIDAPKINPGQHVNAFADDNKTTFLLATTMSAGVGLNLQKYANHVVFMDPVNSGAVMEQAIARVWRMQQKRNCFVFHLLAIDAEKNKDQQITFLGAEHKKYQSAIKKLELASHVFDDANADDDANAQSVQAAGALRDISRKSFQEYEQNCILFCQSQQQNLPVGIALDKDISEKKDNVFDANENMDFLLDQCFLRAAQRPAKQAPKKKDFDGIKTTWKQIKKGSNNFSIRLHQFTYAWQSQEFAKQLEIYQRKLVQACYYCQHIERYVVGDVASEKPPMFWPDKEKSTLLLEYKVKPKPGPAKKELDKKHNELCLISLQSQLYNTNDDSCKHVLFLLHCLPWLCEKTQKEFTEINDDTFDFSNMDSKYVHFLKQVYEYVNIMHQFKSGYHYEHGQFPPVIPRDKDIVSVFYDCIQTNTKIRNEFQFSANEYDIKFRQDEGCGNAIVLTQPIESDAKIYYSLKALADGKNIYRTINPHVRVKASFQEMLNSNREYMSVSIGDMTPPNDFLQMTLQSKRQNFKLQHEPGIIAAVRIEDQEKVKTQIDKLGEEIAKKRKNKTLYSFVFPSLYTTDFHYVFSRCILHDCYKDNEYMSSAQIKNSLQDAASETKNNTTLCCMVLQSVTAVTENGNNYYSYIKINDTWIVMKPDGAVSVVNETGIEQTPQCLVCMKIYTTRTRTRELK